jgi:predicted CopG family antitoxin
MGTKQVRLDEDVYEQIKDKKRGDETFSEAIERLTSDWSLTDYGTERSQKEIERHKELIEESEGAGKEASEEVLEQMGIDVE